MHAICSGTRDGSHLGCQRLDEAGRTGDESARQRCVANPFHVQTFDSFNLKTTDMEGPLEALSTQVDNWIKTHGVRYFDPLTNMAMLTEEVGEVARIMARRYGEQSEKESDRSKDLGAELADVLFVLLCLANQTGTDLQDAWARRMEEKTRRDADRHGSNPKLR